MEVLEEARRVDHEVEAPKGRRPEQAGEDLLMQSLSMTDSGVWAVMTSHDTYYIVDLDKARAMRVPAEGRGALVADRTWFHVEQIECTVGQRMRLSCRGISAVDWYTWRISTDVTSITPWEEFPDAA